MGGEWDEEETTSDERKTFRTLDEDRSIRFNNFLLFLGLFNLVIFILLPLLLLLLT